MEVGVSKVTFERGCKITCAFVRSGQFRDYVCSAVAQFLSQEAGEADSDIIVCLCFVSLAA